MVEVNAIKDKKQIDKLKKVLKKSSIRDYLLFVMGINVGLRISDLLNLKISDVMDTKVKDFLTVKEAKTGKIRTIDLNDSAKEAIKEFFHSLDNYDKDWYLFKSRKGENKPISRVQAWEILNNAAKISGVKGSIGTHTLRKTFGYWSYKQGIDITLLQKMFGHSSPAITLAYIGITKDDIRNVYMNLNL